jgi:hypothetical protein
MKTFSRRGAEAQGISGAFHNEWIDHNGGFRVHGENVTLGYVDPKPPIPER